MNFILKKEIDLFYQKGYKKKFDRAYDNWYSLKKGYNWYNSWFERGIFSNMNHNYESSGLKIRKK